MFSLKVTCGAGREGGSGKVSALGCGGSLTHARAEAKEAKTTKEEVTIVHRCKEEGGCLALAGQISNSVCFLPQAASWCSVNLQITRRTAADFFSMKRTEIKTTQETDSACSFVLMDAI